MIDVKGLTLTPGLIDGFGGVGLPAPRARPLRAAGAPPSPAASPLAPQALALDRVRAGRRAEGRATAASPPRSSSRARACCPAGACS